MINIRLLKSKLTTKSIVLTVVISVVHRIIQKRVAVSVECKVDVMLVFGSNLNDMRSANEL